MLSRCSAAALRALAHLSSPHITNTTRCGHCKALQPAWESAAGALKGIVNVAAVDADAHGSLAQEHGVRGFPTIKLFYAKADGSIATGADYQGPREAKDIVAWCVGVCF